MDGWMDGWMRLVFFVDGCMLLTRARSEAQHRDRDRIRHVRPHSCCAAGSAHHRDVGHRYHQRWMRQVPSP